MSDRSILEMEKRWLVSRDFLLQLEVTDIEFKVISKSVIRQGYTSEIFDFDKPLNRVRWRYNTDTGEKVCHITTKSPKINGICTELETDITDGLAITMLDYLKVKKFPLIEKTRYVLDINNLTFELDIFSTIEGLAILELEFTDENQMKDFHMPLPFIKDITNDHSYSNIQLALQGK